MEIHWLNFGMSSLDFHTYKSKRNLEPEGTTEKDLNYPVSVPALFGEFCLGFKLKDHSLPQGTRMVSVVNMSSFVNKLFWGISEVSLFLSGERRQGSTEQMQSRRVSSGGDLHRNVAIFFSFRNLGE